MKFSGTAAIETVRSLHGDHFLQLGAVTSLASVPIPLFDERGVQVGIVEELTRLESRVVCTGVGDWEIARLYGRARRTFVAPALADIIKPSDQAGVLTSCRVVSLHLVRDPVWTRRLWSGTTTRDLDKHLKWNCAC